MGRSRTDQPADAAVQASFALLQALGLGEGVIHERSTTSAVTTSWGVHWDEENIARDLLQNFYDANRDRLGQVVVDAETETVRAAGPTEHDLEQLFFIGSEKDPAANIGQYGEGFKAAAMCLVRDFGIHPVARSGDRLVCIRLSTESVAKSKLRPLVYDWFRAPTPSAGTELILPHAPPKLRAAMQTGLSHFLHEGNLLVGRKRWESHDEAFALYESTQRSSGAIFYRRLRRAIVPDIPVVLVIDKEYARIEKLIKSDRDRNAFGEKLIKIFYETFARSAVRWSREAQQIIVEAARPVWSRGHPLLAAIAEPMRYHNGWPDTAARKIFGDRYFARAHPHNASEHLRFESTEKQWQSEGREPLPGYFSAFGVLDARAHLEKAEKANVAENRRAPTSAEREAIDQLTAMLRELAPEVHAIFAKDRTEYLIAQSDEVLGALKKGRGYRSREVFLAERLFEGDFAAALATFLHEHAHIFGHDGDRGFTDALTEMLETIIRNRGVFDAAELQWERGRARVAAERRRKGKRVAQQPALRERLAELDAPQLRALLEQVPPVVVRRLLDERPHEDEP